MAKNVKKAKPASKGASKSAAKPAKKPVKVAKAAKKPAAPAKAVKATPVKNGKATAGRPAEAVRLAEAKASPAKGKKAGAPVAKGKASKADGKSKKARRENEIEEDLMVSDEELGAEEIPDLSEFEDEASEEESSVEIEITEVAVATVAAPSDDGEMVLTDAEGRPYCKVKDCDQIAAVDSYCRYHYLLLWKKIQVRRKILVDGKLERYVEELTSRYPDKFLEMIRRDLRTEKDFQSAIAELEIDESGLDNEFEDEAQVLDEVRGFGSESSISDEEEF